MKTSRLILGYVLKGEVSVDAFSTNGHAGTHNFSCPPSLGLAGQLLAGASSTLHLPCYHCLPSPGVPLWTCPSRLPSRVASTMGRKPSRQPPPSLLPLQNISCPSKVGGRTKPCPLGHMQQLQPAVAGTSPTPSAHPLQLQPHLFSQPRREQACTPVCPQQA